MVQSGRKRVAVAKVKESGNWKPGRWNDAHVTRFCRHVRKHCVYAAKDIVGGIAGADMAAFLKGTLDGELRALELRRLGVPLIGDSC